MKKNEQSLREMWDTIKCTNICEVGVQKRREGGGKWSRKIFKEIVPENSQI